MRRWICLLVVAGLAVGTATFCRGFATSKPEDQPKADDKTKALMRRKLEHSHKILEALVLNDLATAGKNAEELLKIRKEPSFKALKTTEYELWSEEFTRSADGIIQAAKDKNLEAAKLHYLGMTMSCFHCHTYTRDMRKGAE